MSVGFGFDFTISQTLEKKLAKLSNEAVREVVAEAISVTLQEGVEMIAESVPSKYSDLKGSIRVVKEPTAESLFGSIGSDHPQAIKTEYGTGIYDERDGASKRPIVIVPINAKVLAFTARDGTRVFTNMVHFDGRVPVAMFRKNYGRIRYRLRKNTKAALDNYFGGL
jgi:hypothetical protein